LPADARASDLFHWQTTLIVNTADSFAKRLMAENSRLVSPGVVTLSEKHLGFSKGLLARDPDGHVMALIEEKDDEQSTTLHSRNSRHGATGPRK
jgi:hypothetical protein